MFLPFYKMKKVSYFERVGRQGEEGGKGHSLRCSLAILICRAAVTCACSIYLAIQSCADYRSTPSAVRTLPFFET